MLRLHARIRAEGGGPRRVLRVTARGDLAAVARSRHALLVEAGSVAPEGRHGFGAVLTRAHESGEFGGAIALPPELAYLAEGDVIRVDPARSSLRVLYRRRSSHNALLVTERCNSRCLMCSQPPVPVDDGHLVDELLDAIPLISPDTRSLGITGGEPTLLQDRFIRLLAAARDHLPRTALHVLSNGRLFAYLRYAEKVARVGHPDLMFGVPLYSDLAERHDFVVQAKGAFDETVRGLLNLARVGLHVEIRVVVHHQTYERLPDLARFIVRNFPFVDQVALMGLEMTGYTRLNLDALWIDPVDYQDELRRAVRTLDEGRLRVMIYNHQLCVLDRRLWPWAVKSISDWKNEYLPECGPCAVRGECGGFFASSDLRRSAHIRAITAACPSPGATQVRWEETGERTPHLEI